MPEFSDCRGGGTRQPWPPTTCNDAVSVMVDFTLQEWLVTTSVLLSLNGPNLFYEHDSNI